MYFLPQNRRYRLSTYLRVSMLFIGNKLFLLETPELMT